MTPDQQRDMAELVRFARAYASPSVRDVPIVFAGECAGPFSCGEAFSHGRDAGKFCPAGRESKPLIIVQVPPDLESRTWPKRRLHRAGAGALQFLSWQEDFLATVAHEFRHLAQFIAPRQERPAFLEVDAESFARFILERWREWQTLKRRGPARQRAAKARASR